MGETISQKIFREHVGHPVAAGEIVVSPVDYVFSHDGNRPQPLMSFAELGAERVFDPEKVCMFLDHSPNAHTVAVAEMHERMRAFAAEQGIVLHELGRGISHQVLPEEGHALPGRLILGSDSHTCTAGAFNLLSTGVGSADLATAMMLGKLWFRVPETIQLIADGTLAPGVYAKDLVLYWLRELGADGANYCAVEFLGEAIGGLSMRERMTITNSAIEMGAKFGIMEADEETRAYLGQFDHDLGATYASDHDAEVRARHHVDASRLTPYVAAPPSPDQAAPVSEFAGTKIVHATIGSSANGQIEDLRAAAEVLDGNTLAKGVRLFIAPASRITYLRALSEGLVQKFIEAGALWGTPGCSGCTGSSAFGVPPDGEHMITSAPRNFTGRTGNRHADIYLASPATVMASAIEGQIADPRHYLTAEPSPVGGNV